MTQNTFSETSLAGADFLEHYGVKGMKWGVRKDGKPQGYQGSNSSNPKTSKKVKARTDDEGYDRIRKLSPDEQTKLAYSKKVMKKAASNGYSEGRNGKPIQFLLENTDDGVEFLNRVSDEMKLPDRTSTKRSDTEGFERISNLTRKEERKLVGSRELLTKAMELGYKDASQGYAIDYLTEHDPDVIQTLNEIADGLKLKDRRVRHADEDEGYLGAYLEHYGVKGMKWGKRKDKDAPKGGSKSGTKTASKSKYGTYTTNADGSREVYVGGVGSAGKHLSEEEQAEADELAPEVEKLKRETNSAYDEVNAIVREIQESPGNKKRFPTFQETNALTALGKKRAEAQKRADELANQYSTKHSRLMKLQSKARAAENQYYKDNPGERRKAVTMPEPGKTTYTSKADNFQGDQARFKKRVKHDDLISMGSSAISTLLSEEDTLTHYGVKGMKWGVRKDGKPQGYQGPSKSKRTAKKVKKAVSDAVDPDKRAKRKKARAKAKFERQRVLEEASAYEKATAESKKNTRENQDTSTTTSTRTNTPPARSEKPKRHGYSPASALSDEELSALNKRFEMEKKYSAFVEERRPKSTTEKVGKFLRKAGTEAASNVTKQLMTKALGAAVTKSTDNLLKSAGAGQPKPKQTPKAQEKPTPKPQESPTPKSTPTPKPNTGPLQGPRNTGPLQGPRNVGPLQGPRNTGPLQGPRNTGARTGPVEARRIAPPAIPTTRAPLEPVSNPRNTRVIETTPSLQRILNKSYSETKASGPPLAGKSWIDELIWDEKRRRR